MPWANMQAVCDKYVPSVKAYLLIPLIGSLFADFLNSLVITFFYQYIIIIEELNMFNIFKKVKKQS